MCFLPSPPPCFSLPVVHLGQPGPHWVELSRLPRPPGAQRGGSVVSQRGDLTFLQGRVSPGTSAQDGGRRRQAGEQREGGTCISRGSVGGIMSQGGMGVWPSSRVTFGFHWK